MEIGAMAGVATVGKVGWMDRHHRAMDGKNLAADYRWVVWLPLCANTQYKLIHDYIAEACYFKVSVKIFQTSVY